MILAGHFSRIPLEAWCSHARWAEELWWYCEYSWMNWNLQEGSFSCVWLLMYCDTQKCSHAASFDFECLQVEENRSGAQ
jgi:hypothetical protein